MKHCAGLLRPSECLLLALWLAKATQMTCRRFVHPSPLRTQVKLSTTEPGLFARWLAQQNRDHDVDTRHVRVKHEDGSVSEPTPLFRVLSQIDPRTQTVIQLSKPGTQTDAIVKITTEQHLRDRFRAEQELAKQVQLSRREHKTKQLELNWAISDHDLELKLKQLENFIDKGRKVEILLASKKKQRRAEPAEAELVLQKLRDKLVDIDAKEIAPMEGFVLGQAMIVVQKKSKN